MTDAERERRIKEIHSRLPVIVQGDYAREFIRRDLAMWDAMRAAPNPRIDPTPIVYRRSGDTRPARTQGVGHGDPA